MTVAFDANIWISFTIGKRLATLKTLLLEPLLQPQITVYSCPEILAEYRSVVKRPKLKKYISAERVEETLDLIERVCQEVILTETAVGSRDAKDNYLLALAQQISLDYLVSGDRDVLILNRWQHTQLISFVQFEVLLSTSSS